MDLVVALTGITAGMRPQVGGKAAALASALAAGLQVPPGVCVTTRAYQRFVGQTGLEEKLAMEIHRKAAADMRWEEMWDASLRIAHLFRTTRIPDDLRRDLMQGLQDFCAGRTLAVRSSSPAEDSSQTSFAGLHESVVHLSGTEAVLDALVEVWASLWSNRAILYRAELGLDPESSAMAVVVQEMVAGERSGVAFTRNPNDAGAAVIEAVYGLCQGLVDGQIQPDRWILDRTSGRVLSSHPARSEHMLAVQSGRVKLVRLPRQRAADPVLSPGDIEAVFQTARKTEQLFGAPQDVEWTFAGERLYLLQARPITTGAPDDERNWYLDLQGSFEQLAALRIRIEQQHLPAMRDEADRLARIDLTGVGDDELVRQVELRHAALRRHRRTYHEEFIPFAHGMRLFGQVFNRKVRPDDPFAFTALLARGDLMSMERNRILLELAARLRDDPALEQALRERGRTADAAFEARLDQLIDRFGSTICLATGCDDPRAPVLDLLLSLVRAQADRTVVAPEPAERMEQSYFESFPDEERTFAGELLDLARASWKLRDDDNLYLERFEGQLLRACTRAAQRGLVGTTERGIGALCAAAKDKNRKVDVPGDADQDPPGARLRARQLIGQPAGPGLARGKARVLLQGDDLRRIEPGDILVCDAIDPAMTFAVPLAAGVVERRGGMLIHGAIIAREYGLPCVTGVPRATERIATGEDITVDGHLGIVTIHRA